MRKVLIAVMCVCAGCGPVMEQNGPAIQVQECEYLLSVVVDMSGSFDREMQSGTGRAYRLLMRTVDRFFRDRIGSNDRIIISQVSGTERALLWEGNPRTLRQQFGSATAFGNFLLMNSHSAGSRIHDGVKETIEYMLDFPGVSNGKTKSLVMVLSDMDDNFPDTAASRERLLSSLKTYAQTGGVAAIYWCDQRFVPDWRRDLKAARFRSFVVESDIAADPAIPTFDD